MASEVEFLDWKGTMIVPKKPAPPRGALFLWPALQPLQMDQNVGYGVLQPSQTEPVDDVIFTNVVATLSGSQPQSCYPSETGTTDYFSPPRASADGKTCCFSKIILRAQGVMASSPNEP